MFAECFAFRFRFFWKRAARAVAVGARRTGLVDSRPGLLCRRRPAVLSSTFHTTIYFWTVSVLFLFWRAQRTYWYAQRTFCLIFFIFHHMSPASAQKVLKMTFFEVYVVHQKRIKKKIIRSICTEKKSLQFDRRNSWLSSYWKCSYKKKILSGGFLSID